MVGDRVDGAGVDVRRRAEFERDATVADEGGEAAQVVGAVAVSGDVVDDPDAVAEPLGAAELDGLPDRCRAERLAGVDREVEVLPLQVLEGLEVSGWRIPGLATGDVEADDPVVPVPDRQLGDLGGVGVGAHRREQRADREVRARRALGEARQHGLDDLVGCQPLRRVQGRGEADLGVDGAVGGQVGGALGGNPVAGLGVLHDADGVGEGLEVEAEVAPAGPAEEPVGQFVDVGGRQVGVAVGVSQFEDGGGSQATVQVVVQDDLGGLPDGGRVEEWTGCRCFRHGAGYRNRRGHGPVRLRQLASGWWEGCATWPTRS